MKKVLLSLGIIALVAGVVAGGTIAYFSDTAVVEDNVFAMGTVELGETWDTPPFELENLAPGEEYETDLAIQYDGTLPADLYVGAQEQSGWDDLGAILEYRIAELNEDWKPVRWAAGGSDEWIHFGYSDHLMSSWTKVAEELEEGDWGRVRLHIRVRTEPLDDTVDMNDFQGAEEKVSIILHAVQPDGEAPETAPRDW